MKVTNHDYRIHKHFAINWWMVDEECFLTAITSICLVYESLLRFQFGQISHFTECNTTMRPVRHRRFSEDSTSNLKKSVQSSGHSDDADDKATVKSSKKPKVGGVVAQKNCIKLKVKAESHNHSKEDKCLIPKRQKKNELSILIDANIEHYSGRRRRGSIDMKTPRAAKVASESPKKIAETRVATRELRNGREANYLVDVSDDESPPPKKKIKREPVELVVSKKAPVQKCDDNVDSHVKLPVKKKTRVVQQLKKEVLSDDSLDAPPPIRRKKIKVIQVAEKKEVFSDESLDAPVPPRKKPRDFQRLKQRAKFVKKDLTLPVVPAANESGFQNEFLKSVLQKRNLLSDVKPKEVKPKLPRGRPRLIKPPVQATASPLIPATVPVSAFSPPPVSDLSNKCHFIPYPVITDTSLDKLTKYSFECLPQNEVWFHTYIRQDLGAEQSRFHNVYPVKAGEGFSFELPHEMPISRVLSKSTKTPLKKTDVYSARPSFVPKRLLRNLGESSPDKVWEDSDASNHSSSVLQICENATDEPTNGENGSDTNGVIPDSHEALEKKRRQFRKLKPSLDDFARKSPRCHASTLAMLSELRHKQCSDVEDSHSDSGDSKSEKIVEPVKILEATELERFLLKPVPGLSIAVKTQLIPELDVDFLGCEFDEVLDHRQLGTFTFNPENLPSFPLISDEKCQLEKVSQVTDEKVEKKSDIDVVTKPDCLENHIDVISEEISAEVRVSSRLMRKSESGDNQTESEDHPRPESQVSISSKKSKISITSLCESIAKHIECENPPRSVSRASVSSKKSNPPRSESQASVLPKTSVKVKRGRPRISVSGSPKKLGRPKKFNRTGWPTSRRKPPSRASVSSVESQDSRLFLTPLPADCFDDSSQEALTLSEMKLCNGHSDSVQKESVKAPRTRRRSVCKKK